MYKRLIVPILLIVALNLFMHLIFIPYAQASANTHMPVKGFFGWGIIFMNIGLAIFAFIMRIISRPFRLHHYVLFAAGINLQLWLFLVISKVICEGCANGG